ncbi:MAG: endolytic transglycosylase MltG [Elusimicrobia bacterium HGW-Elusimicrobia-1]|jgi:UPF0755 protein|nr:MAG: endolytic transglycosylase MltG [Elusimicrobia bacterium HGW-Elusimicrobia-1]
MKRNLPPTRDFKISFSFRLPSSGRFSATLTALVLATALYFFYAAVIANDLETKILVDIPRDSTAARASRILADRGAVKSPGIFRYWLKLARAESRIKAGVYEIAPRESVFGVASKIVRGDSHRIRLTVPEGYEAARIAALAESSGLGASAEFLAYVAKNGLEGYLFPETYFFDYGSTAEAVARRMKEEFDRRITPDMLERAKETGLDLRRLVILASIIEKEATKNDRRLVSAVFHNRLKRRMYLESCATVLYALGKHKDRLIYADLRVKSPYNTYLNYGLPPGPISNPGMESIMAALYPDDSAALFFVVDETSGTHIFSRYYKDHLGVQKKPAAQKTTSR